MATYNAKEYCEDAISSVLKQSFPDFEFIIVDDGSTDGTVELLERIEDRRVVLARNEKNLGHASSLNLGLRLAQGEYIFRMDQDDISEPDRLRVQLEYMRANPAVSICGSWVTVFGGSRPWLRRLPEHDARIRAYLPFDTLIAHPAVCIRRGGFSSGELLYDEALSNTEDYELWGRLILRARFANVPIPLLRYRVHARQTSSLRLAEQRALASKIRIGILQRLGLDASGDEILLHQRLAEMTPFANAADLTEAENWIHRLCDKLSVHGIRDFREIGILWWRVCRQTLGLGPSALLMAMSGSARPTLTTVLDDIRSAVVRKMMNR